MDTADPDAVRLDDLDSNASLDEDAVPMRKVTANNKVGPIASQCMYRRGRTDEGVASYANLDRRAQGHSSTMARDARFAKQGQSRL